MIEILGSSRIRDARRRGGTLQSRWLCKWRPWRQVQPQIFWGKSLQRLHLLKGCQDVRQCSACCVLSLYGTMLDFPSSTLYYLENLDWLPSHALHRKTDLKTSQTSLHASSRAWTWMKHIEALYHVMIYWYILRWVMHGMTSMAGSEIKKTADACEIKVAKPWKIRVMQV